MKSDSAQIFADGIVALFGAIFLVLGKTIEGLWKSRLLFSLIIFVLLWFVFPNWYKENALWGNIILIASVVIPLITWVVTGVKKIKEKREGDQVIEQMSTEAKLRVMLDAANKSIEYLKDEYKQLADGYRRLEEKCHRLEEEKLSQAQTRNANQAKAFNTMLCFNSLHFKEIPKNVDEVKKRYRELAKLYHPDTGGNGEFFNDLKNAYDECLKYFSNFS